VRPHPINATAVHKLVVLAAKTIGMTLTAQVNMASFRLALTLHCRLIKNEDNHPPPMLPMSART
jgi:hypothetical protein